VIVEETLPVLPRAVFDCSLYLQAALRRTGPAGRCLDRVEAGEVELLVSMPVLDEVREVLHRPELKPRRKGRLTDWIADDLLAWMDQHTTLIPEVPALFSYARDPDDEPYLNLAVTAGAAYLVTRDRDLLDLQDPDSEPGQALRQLAPRLTILEPVEFLHRLLPLTDA